jgi:hypothetical protein
VSCPWLSLPFDATGEVLKRILCCNHYQTMRSTIAAQKPAIRN